MGQGLIGNVRRGSLPAVAGDDMHRGRHASLGHGNAAAGRHRQSRADPGNHLIGDSGLLQGQGLLAAPAKEEGVASLQPRHRAVPQGLLNQQAVDFLLRHGVMPCPLAHVYGPGGFGNQGQHLRSHQGVVNHRMGPLQHRPASAGLPARLPPEIPYAPWRASRARAWPNSSGFSRAPLPLTRRHSLPSQNIPARCRRPFSMWA